MDCSFVYLWAKRDVIIETSFYTSWEKVRTFRETGSISKTDENLIQVVVCGQDESVCRDESIDPVNPFSFMILFSLS